jgi:hypothetical protein
VLVSLDLMAEVSPETGHDSGMALHPGGTGELGAADELI